MGTDQSKIKNESTDVEVSREDIFSDFPTVMPEDLKVSIIDIDHVIFEGTVQAAILPTPKYPIAVLPGHTPLFTTLKKGKIIIHKKDGEQEFEIEEGIAKIIQNQITILVGYFKDQEQVIS